MYEQKNTDKSPAKPWRSRNQRAGARPIMSIGTRVKVTAVRFPQHAHHACFIGKTGTVKRVYKTKPYILVTMDSGKDRECCSEFLEVIQ